MITTAVFCGLLGGLFCDILKCGSLNKCLSNDIIAHLSLGQSFVVGIIVKFRPDFIATITNVLTCWLLQRSGFAVAPEAFNQQQEEFEEDELLFVSEWLFTSPTCANSNSNDIGEG